MCGIIAFSVQNKKLHSEQFVSQLLGLQNHRGPDNMGTFASEQIALGHNRLSIIDLSTLANQPMFSDNNELAIVFNGEIYNYREIRKKLKQHGHLFTSNSDTEVLLKAYLQYGKDMLLMLDGMFAFAIYDFGKQELFAARDRFGKKPLFYYHNGNDLIICSELKTIKAFPIITLEVDDQAIDLFLSLQYIPAPFTAYKHVHSLEGSHYLHFKKGELVETNYYELKINKEYERLNFHDAKTLVREKVIGSIRKRMIADVPLGAFLSGGIDSSIISATLACESESRITTISVGFDESGYSELDKARSIAKQYATNHQEYTLSLTQAQNSIETIIRYYDQPFGDSSAIPTYFLSKVAKEQVTVALSGDGGDELFSGYQRYKLDIQLNRINKFIPNFVLFPIANSFKHIKPLTNTTIEKNWPLGLKRLSQVIQINKKASILRWGSYFSLRHKRHLYKGNHPDKDLAVDYLTDLFDQFDSFGDYTKQTRATDLFSYAAGDYLTKIDIASMQNSLEVRCPLLDHELAELAFSLPQSYLQKNGGKHILKDAFHDNLTTEVLKGGKQGFGIPMIEWFKKEWLELLKNYLSSSNSFCKRYNQPFINQMIQEHTLGLDDHSKRLYLLLVLEIWHQTPCTKLQVPY